MEKVIVVQIQYCDQSATRTILSLSTLISRFDRLVVVVVVEFRSCERDAEDLLAKISHHSSTI